MISLILNVLMSDKKEIQLMKWDHVENLILFRMTDMAHFTFVLGKKITNIE